MRQDVCPRLFGRYDVRRLRAVLNGRRLIARWGGVAFYEYGNRPPQYVGRSIDEYRDRANMCRTFECAGLVLARVPNEVFLSARVELTIDWNAVGLVRGDTCMACKGEGGEYAGLMDFESYIAQSTWMECRYCRGTGRNQRTYDHLPDARRLFKETLVLVNAANGTGRGKGE